MLGDYRENSSAFAYPTISETPEEKEMLVQSNFHTSIVMIWTT